MVTKIKPLKVTVVVANGLSEINRNALPLRSSAQESRILLLYPTEDALTSYSLQILIPKPILVLCMLTTVLQ